MIYLDSKIEHHTIAYKLKKSGASDTFTAAVVQSLKCAQSSWNPTIHPLRPYMAAVNLDLPASKKRYWLFDLRTGEVITTARVAHGSKSGTIHRATEFSNIAGSKKSSLGLYWIAYSYWSGTTERRNTKLFGLDRGFNDNAKKRAIILHPAHSSKRSGGDYVTDSAVTGRSDGCIALNRESYAEAEERLTFGGLIFQYATAKSDGKDFHQEAWSVNCSKQ